MKIATWNVNSLKVRLPHVLQWLETHRPDRLRDPLLERASVAAGVRWSSGE